MEGKVHFTVAGINMKNTTLIIISSEAAIPNLAHICYLKEKLREVVVIHTEESISKDPARLIKDLLEPRLKIPILLIPYKLGHTESLDEYLSWIDPNEELILNFSGGNKLMTLEILRAVGSCGFAHLTKIYRERDKGWIRFTDDFKTMPLPESEQIDEALTILSPTLVASIQAKLALEPSKDEPPNIHSLKDAILMGRTSNGTQFEWLGAC